MGEEGKGLLKDMDRYEGPGLGRVPRGQEMLSNDLPVTIHRHGCTWREYKVRCERSRRLVGGAGDLLVFPRLIFPAMALVPGWLVLGADGSQGGGEMTEEMTRREMKSCALF